MGTRRGFLPDSGRERLFSLSKRPPKKTGGLSEQTARPARAACVSSIGGLLFQNGRKPLSRNIFAAFLHADFPAGNVERRAGFAQRYSPKTESSAHILPTSRPSGIRTSPSGEVMQKKMRFVSGCVAHTQSAHMCARRAVVGVLFRIVFARRQRSVVQVLPSREGARYLHARRHVAYALHRGARIAEPRAPRTRRSSQPNVAYFPRVVVGRQVARSRNPRRVGYPALEIARIRREIRRRAFGHQKIRHGVGELGRVVATVDYVLYIVAVYQPRVHYEFNVGV